MSEQRGPADYRDAGVDYDALDAGKRSAIAKALSTSSLLQARGARAIDPSRGEPAFVFELDGRAFAFVVEGLGTKSLIARHVLERQGVDRFADVAYDTVAVGIHAAELPLGNGVAVGSRIFERIDAVFGIAGPQCPRSRLEGLRRATQERTWCMEHAGGRRSSGRSARKRLAHRRRYVAGGTSAVKGKSRCESESSRKQYDG